MDNVFVWKVDVLLKCGTEAPVLHNALQRHRSSNNAVKGRKKREEKQRSSSGRKSSALLLLGTGSVCKFTFSDARKVIFVNYRLCLHFIIPMGEISTEEHKVRFVLLKQKSVNVYKC